MTKTYELGSTILAAFLGLTIAFALVILGIVAGALALYARFPQFTLLWHIVVVFISGCAITALVSCSKEVIRELSKRRTAHFGR